jgi:magnesium transporter
MIFGTWYGMNFEHMPELKPAWAYPSVFIVTLVSTVATYWYFRKKKWF